MRNGLIFATLLSLFLISAAPAAEPNTLTPAEVADGWVLLFDGHSIAGWEASNTGPDANAQTATANWKVADGAISATRGPQGLLCTKGEFADFVFRVDFRAAEETNSGVFLRTPLQPASPATDCYELQIAAEKLSPFPTGSFVQRQKAAAVAAPALKERPDWRAFEVTAQGGHFTVELDGQAVLDFTDPKPLARGRIGLQFNTGPVEFRNLKLKPLAR